MNLRKDHSHFLISLTTSTMMVDPCGSPVRPLRNLFEYVWSSGISLNLILFATVDASVRGSRKIAANCVKHCDVRNSENRQSIERTLHGVGSPPSVQVGVFTFARRSAASTQRIVRPATYPLVGTWRSLCPATSASVAWCVFCLTSRTPGLTLS